MKGTIPRVFAGLCAFASLAIAFPSLPADLIHEGFDTFDTGVRPLNWIFTNCNANSDVYTSAGGYGAASPSIKLDATDDAIVTASISSPSTLSLWLRGYSISSSSYLLIEEFFGSTWNPLTSISDIPGSGTTFGDFNLNLASTQLRFTYNKTSGNLAFDDVVVTSAFSPTPTAVIPTPTAAPATPSPLPPTPTPLTPTPTPPTPTPTAWIPTPTAAPPTATPLTPTPTPLTPSPAPFTPTPAPTIIATTPTPLPLAPEGFDGFQTGVRPEGWAFTNCNADSDTYTSAGNFGLASPSVKLDLTGDIVTTRLFAQGSYQLNFWVRGIGIDASSSLLVEELYGSAWQTLADLNNLPTTGTILGPYSLNPATEQLRFSYTKVAGNLAFDDVNVIAPTATPTPLPSPSRTPAPTPSAVPTAPRTPTPFGYQTPSPAPSPTRTASPRPTATPPPTIPPTPTAAPPASGPISGRVYDHDTGAGLSGILVVATGTGGSGNDTTNSGGYYSISGLPVGTYRMEARPPGNAPANNPVYVRQYYNQVYSFNDALWVPTNCAGIDFPMIRGGTITGRVLDEQTEQGLGDIVLAVYSGTSQICWTRSAANGSYTLRPLLTGDYTIFVSTDYRSIIHPEDCYTDQWYDRVAAQTEAETVSVTAGSSTSNLTILVQPCPVSPTPASSPTASPIPTITPPGNLRIYQVWSGVPGTNAFGDGAGQATLIHDPASGTAVLYDCGATIFSSPVWAAAREVLYLMESLGLDRIDYLVISHYDADHYAGVPYLFNGTQRPEDSDFVRNGLNNAGGVGVVYDRGGSYKADGSAIDAAYLAAVGGLRQTLPIGAEIDLGIPGGYAKLKCLAIGNADDSTTPGGDVVHIYNRSDLTVNCTGDPAENAKSIVSLLSYGGFDMWIGGDTSSSLGPCAPVEETAGDVIRNDLDRRLDVLLVDHHGSDLHTSQDFLDLTRPAAALISVWNNSASYDFPRADTCSRLSTTVECGSGRQAILQTSDGRRVCSICGFTARCHIRVETDGNFYSLATDSAARATDCQPITDGAWTNHPVNIEPVVTPTPPLRHLMISQIATNGPAGANDEFCEIYNSTDQSVNIGGWKVIYLTATGSTATTKVTIPSGTSLPAYHYYLTAQPQFVGPVAADAIFTHTAGMSDTGGHLIIQDALGSEWDRIGYGTAEQAETAPAPAPSWAVGQTLMRKAAPNATAAMMCPAGSLYGYGNGYDSDNNAFDFVNQNSCLRTVIRNSSSGSFPPAPPTPSPTPYYPITRTIIESGDYNGDGTADPAIFRSSVGFWSVRDFTRLYFGADGDTPVSGDYNGDGSADIAAYRSSSGLWGIRNVSRVFFGSALDLPAPADYDGDGSADIGLFRDGSGLWAVRNLTRAYLGSTGDLAVPADYNGDGADEIAVFRSSRSLWSVRNFTRTYFGSSSDWPVPGDYNADGISEPAIFRSYYSLWNARGVTRAYFGGTNDLPVPADYSGDGTRAIGIFRPPAGLWSIRGVTNLYFGATMDLPVTW
jgi:hypothetical protein